MKEEKTNFDFLDQQMFSCEDVVLYPELDPYSMPTDPTPANQEDCD